MIGRGSSHDLAGLTEVVLTNECPARLPSVFHQSQGESVNEPEKPQTSSVIVYLFLQVLEGSLDAEVHTSMQS